MRDPRTPTIAADARHLTRRMLRRVRYQAGRALIAAVVAVSGSER
ncbi:hypothetical protein [Rhodococcus aerolatus]